MRVLIMLVIIALVAVAAIGWYASRGQQQIAEVISTPTPSPQSQVPENWIRYTSEQYGFSVYHPPEMQVREDASGEVVFFMTGPTQREGTEVYDGVMVSVRRGEYEEATLEAFVRSQQAAIQREPTNPEVGEVVSRTIQGRQGYQFTVSNLGDFTHLYLPVKGKEFVRIIYLVEDPSNQGFEQLLQRMAETVEVS